MAIHDQGGNVNTTTGASITSAGGSGLTTGQLAVIAVAFAYSFTVPTSTSITDGTANVFNRVVVGSGIDLWYCDALHSSGGITVSFNQGGFPLSGGVAVFVHSYSNQISPPYDTSSITGSITPTNSGELLYSVSTSSAPPSGFTNTINSGAIGAPYAPAPTFYESQLLSCPSGANTVYGAAGAFFAFADAFSPRWVSI